MFKGRLILKMYGDLKETESIHRMEIAMRPPINSISDKFDFNYKRFEFLTADLIWVIELTSIFSPNRIYNSFKDLSIKYFSNWGIEITVLIIETGE